MPLWSRPIPLSQLELDTRLGELAAEMETRMHGGVSVQAVRTTNHRDPLNHRSLLERLVRASPSDGMLLIDANADAELLHITANNGLCRGVPHSQVPSEMEEELQSQLRRGLDHGELVPVSSIVPGPVEGRDEWAWMATESGGLFVVIYRLAGESRVPVAAFATGEGKRGMLSWEALWQNGPHPASRWPAPPLWDTDGPLHVPIGRWLLSRLLPPALSIGVAASWLVAFSRCVAWSWFLLARPPARIATRTAAESPLVQQWARAISQSMEASGNPVEIKPGGWRLAASDEQAVMEEPCIAVSLWAPGAPGPGEGSPMLLIIRPRPDGTVRTDRHPGLSGSPFHPDLDDYLEGVLVTAAGIYWTEHGSRS